MGNKKTVTGLEIDLDLIPDQNTRVTIRQLLNVLEWQFEEIKQIRKQNQELKDEINRLKGEQGQPKIRKQTDSKEDVSSEKERKNSEDKKPAKPKPGKKKQLGIHETKRLAIDKAELPEDGIFKGLHLSVIQDIKISPYNVQFEREIYYSPSLKKSMIAPLPDGYRGDFAPGLKALVLELHHKGEMTESAIHRFLRTHAIAISPASISRLLTEHHEQFHEEKEEIVRAGLRSSSHQQMDDTGARVNGKNYYLHILCNEYYTAYFTRRQKTRLTIIDILSQGEMAFHFNESSYSLMEQMQMSEKMLRALKLKNPSPEMNREGLDRLFSELFPMRSTQQTNGQIILEASLIIAYQSRKVAVKILLTDDAPQFKQITELFGLCWVHDGRHDKKLTPFVPLHRRLLASFLGRYWTYYDDLLSYKVAPSREKAEKLSIEFDRLFSTVTGYEQLDQRIKKTKKKKAALLLVLAHPSLPLHNNAELGARKQARYRDISYHTINEKGTEANDTFKTIIQTAKKLGVNSYQYLQKRISNTLQSPTLAQIISSKANTS